MAATRLDHHHHHHHRHHHQRISLSLCVHQDTLLQFKKLLETLSRPARRLLHSMAFAPRAPSLSPITHNKLCQAASKKPAQGTPSATSACEASPLSAILMHKPDFALQVAGAAVTFVLANTWLGLADLRRCCGAPAVKPVHDRA